MIVPWAQLFGRQADHSQHEEFEDDVFYDERRVQCWYCGEENLHFEGFRTSRRWSLVNSQGDIHECPPVDADRVFTNLDEETDDGSNE